jgi:hypothetical protein
MMKFQIINLTILLLLTACGGSNSSSGDVAPIVEVVKQPISSENLPIPDNSALDNYQVLIIGNSHSQPMQKLLTILFSHGLNDKNVAIETRIASFLDVIVDNEDLISLIEKKPWTHIILQGQKYSQSQSVQYSTEETKIWIQRAKNIGATPILFPEHPQQGSPQEALYVHSIHEGIASEESACVAPVGLTWNKVLEIEPALDLYHADGNHAKELGSLLTALVLYQMVSGEVADLLPYIDELPGTEATQALLGQLASQTIAKNISCKL